MQKAGRYFDGKALGLLSGAIDRYNGITIMSDFDSITNFDTTLGKSLDTFKTQEHLRSVWLKIPKQNLDVAHIATSKHGFDIHHAKPEYLMLTKWLDDSCESRLPGYATHYIGVGGMVLNKQKTKLLCI